MQIITAKNRQKKCTFKKSRHTREIYNVCLYGATNRDKGC